MNRILSTVALLLLFNSQATSQLANYFQQEVNYKINVLLNDANHTLQADMEFEYINNSPHTLDSLIIHLWPNAYKNPQTAMAKQQFAQRDYALLRMPEKSRGHIDSLKFTQNGTELNMSYFEGYEDIAVIRLVNPIAPGARTVIKTPFFVKLPSGSISRLGHIGQSYQITQWFPKPAVFDNEGWHAMPYLTQGEFYSEFGSFDVKITLPANYTVGATGDLQTQSEIERMNELANLPHVSGSMEFPASSAEFKTLHYKQDRVHDFGWFADKRWIVRKGEVELPHSKRKVTTWALFTPQEASIWEKTGIQSINDGVYYYSKWIGDYPYNVCTAVDGTISAGGGMEYPTVTVIGSSGSVSSLKTVIIHEVGHNWFYGILGSNERDNPWMDEGINSFFETRTLLATSEKEGGPELNLGGLQVGKMFGLNQFSYQYLSEEILFLFSARGNKDQPIQAHSADYTNLNYGTIVYKKAAIAFNYLMNYLGEETFDKCMQAYYDEWKFKHPSPQNLRTSFEKTSGKDLRWFFDELVNTTAKVNHRAAGVKRVEGGYQLRVGNAGQVSAPFSVDVIRDGKQVSRQWFDGMEPLDLKKVVVNAQKGDVLIVNNVDGIPEYNKQNNRIRTSGLFRRMEPIELKMLTRLDNPKKTQLFWNPLIGWNNYNKWMVGLQLHNMTIPQRDIEWSLAPMYSIATNSLTGFAKLGFDNGKIAIGVKGQRFALDDFHNDPLNYVAVKPYITFNLLSNRIKKDVKAYLGFEYVYANYEYKRRAFDIWSINDELPVFKESGITHVGRVKFQWSKKMLRSDLRWNSSLDVINNVEPFRSTTTFLHQHAVSYDYIYRGKGKKAIRTRLYYGSSGYGPIMLTASGQTGLNDYAYDGLFLGRTEKEGLLSNQFMRNQGALAVPTNMMASKHLASLNVEFDLPVKFPLGVYGGAAFISGHNYDLIWDKRFLIPFEEFVWNAGVTVPLIRNIFQIYVPVVYSNQIKNEFKTRDLKFGETIMFELNLNMVNPFEILKNLEL
jgi:hypothetical protein